MTAVQHFGDKRLCHQSLQTFYAILTVSTVKVIRQISVMSILCSSSVLKELPRTIKNIIFDSKVTCKPFTLLEEFPFGFLSSLILMYHLSLQELGIDNTAQIIQIHLQSYYLLLWSIVKRSKELSKLQCFWDFYILFHKFRLGENNFFALIPRYYRLSLLQTLNLPPDHEGVHNNRSRLNHLISD